MDHAVYDVWVLDCLDNAVPNAEAKKSETQEELADEKELAPAKAEETPAVKDD